MSGQARYGAKGLGGTGGSSPSQPAAIGGGGAAGRLRASGQSTAAAKGKCEALKTDVFDYGEPGHTELYRRSREELLDYVRVEFDQGGAVAESIISGAAQYPPEPTDPAVGATRTQEEIWKRRVASFVRAQEDIDRGLKQAYTLMWGQCTQRLRDKLETNTRYAVVSAAKDVFALDAMIQAQAHETMDSRRKKAWTALESKLSVLNFHQEQVKLNDVEFYREFAGRIQGLKTGKVAIGKDDCVVETLLQERGLTMENATPAAKEAALATAENEAIVMLYLRNINQAWHGAMVRYLEDAYATGNDIYPASLPDAYRFLDDWKTRHRIRGVFSGKGDGVTLINAGNEGQEGKRDERFIVPGKEHVLCWDCNYFGHGRGNKVCPNYDPSKAASGWKADKDSRKEQAHATADNAPGNSEPPAAPATVVSSLSGGAPGVPIPSKTNGGSITMCHVGTPIPDTQFSFFQGYDGTLGGSMANYILLDNQSTCHIFKDRHLLSNIHPAERPIAVQSTGGVSYAWEVGYIRNFSDPVWVCDGGIANILSFAKVRDLGCKIDFDSERDVFVVHGPSKKVEFRRLPSGLYGHQVPTTGVCLVDRVEDRAEGYSLRQQASARLARKAMSMMGHPLCVSDSVKTGNDVPGHWQNCEFIGAY